MDADKLQELADEATSLANKLRELAHDAQLAERNAKIEDTGKQLREVVYETRDLGYGPEIGIVRGYWADGHDWIGKREFIPADGSASLYLFDDEIVSDEEVS